MNRGVVSTELDPTVRKLDNGLTVAMERLPYVHSVTVGVWITAGSANETAKHAGISHFLEHLLFKGTGTRTSRELMEAIESRGGHMNAFTSRENTCLYVKCLDEHISTAIEILGDIIKNSTFHDLDKERNVILEEIATSLDTPDEYIHDCLMRRFWPDHALGRPIAGFNETVSQTKFEDVRAYMDAWYTPGTMCVSVVGNFDEATVFRQIEEEFGALPAGSPHPKTAAPQFGVGVEAVDRPIAQNHIAFAFPGVPIVDERRYTYDLLSSVLGGGSTSRLFERIREQEGMAYAIYAFGASFASTGMLGIYAAVAPENLRKTLDLCFKEMDALHATPIDDAELDSNKQQLKGSLLLALEGTFNRMSRLARSLLIFGRVVPVEEILHKIESVTAEDIQRLAGEVLTKERCALAVLGPQNGVGSELL